MIPFNKPHMTGNEVRYISEAHKNGKLAGDGPFTARCHEQIEFYSKTYKALLTHSCTAALEMGCMLADLKPGDEVIMPSFTFVSTANAVVQRGAIPVFVDIREDTLNIDERQIEGAITGKTRALLPMHYAGVACEMDTIIEIARKNGLVVIEDAAQGIMARYRDLPLGSIGDLGTFSFHETKNIISGEGGCLLINRADLVNKAEIIREKGTDRNRFFRGEVDKYTWQSIGSSYLPGEMVAAFLSAQLEQAQEITDQRLSSWEFYHKLLQPFEGQGLLRRPIVPDHCQHNGHIYYVLLSPDLDRDQVLTALREQNISAVFHYVPLHSSPAGEHYGRVCGDLLKTDDLSARLIRLPLWYGISPAQQKQVVETLNTVLKM
ncbi:MAG: dTDP-4-amino-4,6-dideoxygalactose transaminase [bacterium]